MELKEKILSLHVHLQLLSSPVEIQSKWTKCINAVNHCAHLVCDLRYHQLWENREGALLENPKTLLFRSTCTYIHACWSCFYSNPSPLAHTYILHTVAAYVCMCMQWPLFRHMYYHISYMFFVSACFAQTRLKRPVQQQKAEDCDLSSRKMKT